MVFHWFSLHNVVAPLWDNRWTCWRIVFISEKHISGTYFGENLIDIRGGADVDPLVAPDLLYTRVGIQLIW